MLSVVFELARPLLYALDPEHAHELTLKSLEAGIYPRPSQADDARLRVNAWGLDFPNPLGIAAGFDKDARVPAAILGMGFGHAEIGTITPRPQDGNPRPRVFRLIGDRALINRLGFNNAGHAAALARLQTSGPRGVVGINVGANKDATDRAADYVAGVAPSTTLRATLRSTSPRPTRRACATCRRRRRWTTWSRACCRRAPRWSQPASRSARS